MRHLISALLLVCLSAQAQTSGVVNTALQRGVITREDARNIYLLRERSWVDGTRVQVYRMTDEERVHREFLRDVLSMSPQQFKGEWERLVNSGLAQAVGIVRDQREMLSVIARKPNAVGYLSKDYIVLNAGGNDVQIIRIAD